MAFKRRTKLGRRRAELFPIALMRDRSENTCAVNAVATSDAEARMSNAGVIIAAIIATAADGVTAFPIRHLANRPEENSQSEGSLSISSASPGPLATRISQIEEMSAWRAPWWLWPTNRHFRRWELRTPAFGRGARRPMTPTKWAAFRGQGPVRQVRAATPCDTT